jgi:DNA repair protein RadA/Sms
MMFRDPLTIRLVFHAGEVDTARMTNRTSKSVYICTDCGHSTPKWIGQCPGCGTWNSIEERIVTARPGAVGKARFGTLGNGLLDALKPVAINEMHASVSKRIETGISELDRVLGGGFVPGTTVLLGGDPGIGKSTLLLQAASKVAATYGNAMYATGEESAEQIKQRADRLDLPQTGLYAVSSGDVLALGQLVEEVRPAILVVDSIQTAWHSGIEGSVGSIGQVRQAAAELCSIARNTGTAIILAGHVTKEGSIAGPKVLEHVVDVVLQIEGETGTSLRVLRGTKNRHGATDELGVFEMTGRGLSGVSEPSKIFLSQRQPGASGSAVATVIEGTRPLTVEVQALLTHTQSTSPRRTSAGYDIGRLHLLIAVISKRLRLPLGSNDVVVNIAGGLRISEPAADLAVALAIVSSFMDVPVRDGLSASGEIGLGGEMRAVRQAGRRAAEAKRLGFDNCLVPMNSGDLGDAESVAVRTATLASAVRFALPAMSQQGE